MELIEWTTLKQHVEAVASESSKKFSARLQNAQKRINGKDSIFLLIVSDFGTIGLPGDDFERKNHIFKLTRSAHVTDDTEKNRDGKSAASVAKLKSLEKKKDAAARKSFETQKKMKMAQTVVATATGAIEAYATGMSIGGAAGPVVGAMLAGLVIAMGAKSLATIASTSYQGGGSSGAGGAGAGAGAGAAGVTAGFGWVVDAGGVEGASSVTLCLPDDAIAAALLVGVLAPLPLLASPSTTLLSASADGPVHVPVARDTGAMMVRRQRQQ